MIRNYFRTAWRILSTQKFFSAINVLGLSIGMAVCLLIVPYISFELSYDDFQKNGDHMYRINHQIINQGHLIANLPKTYSAIGPKRNFYPISQWNII
jgi:putative ABC transport system permease protein